MTEAGFEPGFEIVEHTADFGLEARGRDLAELFVMMARALFTLIADLDSIRPVTGRVITLRAGDLPGLLRDWLAELNYLHAVHGELYCRFVVKIDGGRLEARVSGERLDAARHDLRHEVKAITRHDLVVEPVTGGWRGHVLLDV